MLKLGRRARGHFVSLIEICVHPITLNSFLDVLMNLLLFSSCTSISRCSIDITVSFERSGNASLITSLN